MFRAMDSDLDNLISANQINLSGLPLKTLVLLKPIFDELENIPEGIDMQEFTRACSRLYKVSFIVITNSFIVIRPCFT